MQNKKYTLLIEENTIHDGGIILLDNEKILCILENERVTKHKHAVYESCDEIVDYIAKSYNINKDDITVMHGLNIPYNNHHIFLIRL